MKRVIASFLVCVAFPLFQSMAFGDVIELADGKKILKVRIVEETVSNVFYKKGSLPNQSVPSDRVKAVLYSSTSNDYKTAMDTYVNEDYMSAAELFQDYGDALGEKKASLSAHCLYLSSECYQKSAQWDNAIKAFSYFANTFNNHRLYPDALRQRAICYMNKGDMKKAREGFIILKNALAKKEAGEFWDHEVEYWFLYLKEIEKGADMNRALDDYKALFSKVENSFPSVANKTRLRMGRVLTAQRKYQDALGFFNEVIDNRFDSENEVVAHAYLGRGRCIFNKPDRTEEELKSARYDFLRTVVHYTRVGSAQPEGMFWAGKCFQILGGKDSGKRWQGLYRRLKREWPGNYWTQQAAKEL